MAESAREAGHDVTLVSGPVSLAPPRGVTVVNVVSAREMLEVVRERVAWSDVLVMCAAVADWRPRDVAESKIKKRNVDLVLELEPNPDILMSVKPLKGERVFVGFAAETGNVLAEARRKLEDKGLDLIVANDVTQSDAGFDVDTNRVTFLESGKTPLELPLMSKKEVARHIVEWCGKRQGEEK